MTPIKVRDANTDFTPPKDWDDSKDGSCGILSVRREEGVGGRPYLYSNWRPSPEELASLNAGGTVELLCVGSQPPVALSVIAAR